MTGALEGIRRFFLAGYEIHVVSNQGCVAKGEISLEGLNDLTQRMLKKVEAAGGKIHGVHYCPHESKDRCECKKPKTLLFHRAVAGREVDWSKVFFIGDSEEDIEAGRNLGCKTILVLSGRNRLSDVALLKVKPDTVKENLLECAEWLLA